MAAAGAAARPAATRALYLISDVHTDYAANLEWIESLPERSDCAIIVAGDVSDDLAVLERTLRALRARFGWVFYTPGNHDLWLGRKQGEMAEPPFSDSLAKARAVFALCRRCGIEVAPLQLPQGPLVVPIHSWYHESWDREPDIDPEEWEGIPEISKVFVDYRRCLWPGGAANGSEAVAEALDALNDCGDGEDFPWDSPAASEDRPPVVSFSHFLPWQELCPEKRYLFLPNLPKAVGSAPLARRVERLRPDMHCFGHTHFAWDSTVNGVRCVQASLAYPQERQRRGAYATVGLPLEALPLRLWAAAEPEAGSAGGRGGWAPPVQCFWSAHYASVPRDPSNVTDLADYVAQRYRRRSRDPAPDCRPPAG